MPALFRGLSVLSHAKLARSKNWGLTIAWAMGYANNADNSTRYSPQAVSKRGSGSGVERLLAKEKVAGSNPVSRSLW